MVGFGKKTGNVTAPFIKLLFSVKRIWGIGCRRIEKPILEAVISRDELDYKNLDLYAILCRIAQLISLNKNGFDFLKNGNCNCSKCNGAGFIPQFAHYANGVCFDCGGTGIKSGILKEYIKKQC